MPDRSSPGSRSGADKSASVRLTGTTPTSRGPFLLRGAVTGNRSWAFTIVARRRLPFPSMDGGGLYNVSGRFGHDRMIAVRDPRSGPPSSRPIAFLRAAAGNCSSRSP